MTDCHQPRSPVGAGRGQEGIEGYSRFSSAPTRSLQGDRHALESVIGMSETEPGRMRLAARVQQGGARCGGGTAAGGQVGDLRDGDGVVDDFVKVAALRLDDGSARTRPDSPPLAKKSVGTGSCCRGVCMFDSQQRVLHVRRRGRPLCKTIPTQERS